MTVAQPQPNVATELDPCDMRNPERLRQPVRPAKRPLTPQTLKIRQVDIVVFEDRCKGCTFCIEFCPKHVLRQGTKLNIRGVRAPQVMNPDMCIGCGVCEEVCPDFAIFLVDKRERR